MTRTHSPASGRPSSRHTARSMRLNLQRSAQWGIRARASPAARLQRGPTRTHCMAATSSAVETAGLVFATGDEGAWDEAAVGTPVVSPPALCNCSHASCRRQCWGAAWARMGAMHGPRTPHPHLIHGHSYTCAGALLRGGQRPTLVYVVFWLLHSCAGHGGSHAIGGQRRCVRCVHGACGAGLMVSWGVRMRVG